MRVTIDAIPLLLRSAGVKNYLYHWTRHLLQERGAIDVRLFPFLNAPRLLDHEASAAGAFTTFTRLGLLFLLNHAEGDVPLPLQGAGDVFHACKFLNPPLRGKLTATLHDLTCWILPETHSPANVAADRVFAERVLSRADGIIAVSEATRCDAIRLLKLPPEKIRVIYHGIAEPFFQVRKEDAERVRSRLGLARPYILFVGTIEPRKNIDALLNAYEALPASLREEFDFVFAGPSGWAPMETMARLQNPVKGVRYLGYVAEDQLPGLFAGATVFVYPSLYEGFGFPVAQAMAAGTPVITSGVSALPEVSGGTAVLIDPRSGSELVSALRDTLTSPSKRADLTASGRTNARRFSWAGCARQSLEFFREVAGR
jgi:glycosyltransferase involved in cell wall biosynthesis